MAHLEFLSQSPFLAKHLSRLFNFRRKEQQVIGDAYPYPEVCYLIELNN